MQCAGFALSRDLLQCDFHEVHLLDADNLLLADPAAILITPPLPKREPCSGPPFNRWRQSYTCERVAPYRFATPETDLPARKLSAASAPSTRPPFCSPLP